MFEAADWNRSWPPSSRFERGQTFLLPPDMKDWLPADGLAHFVMAAAERVSMSAFQVNDRNSGKPQYHPCMMLALLVYAHANGLFSSRRIGFHAGPGEQGRGHGAAGDGAGSGSAQAAEALPKSGRHRAQGVDRRMPIGALRRPVAHPAPHGAAAPGRAATAR